MAENRPDAINRETSRRALDKLSVGNRLRLMFGHEVDKSDPGYPEFKRIINEASGRLTPKDKTP